MIKGSASEAYEKIAQELRRGVVILAALSRLRDDKYGYALIRDLAEHGLEIDQGTLYPLLRRLESQGLLESKWDVEGSRPRRYYVVTATGREVLTALRHDWHSLTETMSRLLSKDGA
jgi:PadR family transcriptional regulator, regulatory protein PadR